MIRQLEATLARLQVDEHRRLVAGEPSGGDWYGLDAVIDGDLVTAWLDDLLAGVARGHVDVAGVYLASWLGGAVAEPVAAAVSTLGRAWPLDPEALAVHRHPQGWFDGLAVRRGPVGEADLDAVAGGLVDLLDPVFATIRRRTRLGLPAMWGSVGDGIACAAADRARSRGVAAAAEWDAATALIEAIAQRAPQVRARRALSTVEWSGGTADFAVRGTCCLYYKVAGMAPDEAYCARCPLRAPDDQRRKWAAWLERTG